MTHSDNTPTSGAVSTEQEAEPDGTVTRYQSFALLGASILAAVATLGATMIAQRSLGSEQLKEFLLFWAALFMVTGIITGIQPEVTRAVGAARRDGVYRVRVVYVAGAFGALAGVLVMCTAPLWASRQVPLSSPWAVGAIAAGVFFYALQAMMSGASAGRDNWYLFAGIGGLESVGRLTLMLAAAFAVPTLIGLEVATVAPMMLWILLALFVPGGRKAWSARADIDVKQLSMNLIWSFLSSAAAAVLMMGFPNILNESEPHQDEHTKLVMAALILAISITRSPIMIPLQAFQGVAVSAFLKQQHRPAAAFVKPAAAVLGVGAVGAGAAYLIGPLLFKLIYPPKGDTQAAYAEVVTGTVLGVLVFASALLALMTLSGNMVLAINRHRAYVAGWAVAAAVAVAVAFFAPLPLVPRAIAALCAGPVCGFAVHLAAMMVHARSVQALSEGEALREMLVENTMRGETH
ncbi:MAG: hypothetical protein Q3991_00240 [Rothia sp. (in: high G+C Gram-positive bacteria)]|uniref:hypothetical protein n=1 Tax=Rothia sp. (in: high G+C Gram-positive bacteria) TaxID=1885016 RepID=UPI0026DC4F40|nr:hypothetical protein [Rothia sp. (in: high G+C Gram-positive bacteria)]MDO4883355.1 hypothetical protein [Rothia sp. (in: high G+C Gram-positive bacteria)]